MTSISTCSHNLILPLAWHSAIALVRSGGESRLGSAMNGLGFLVPLAVSDYAQTVADPRTCNSGCRCGSYSSFLPIAETRSAARETVLFN